MKVSVIIANRNDTVMLAVTVRSCIEELKPLGPGNGEIIICDNSDKNIYKKLSNFLPIGYIKEGLLKVYRQSFPCLYTAREEAISKASADYVLCLDSHMICGRNMILDLVNFMDSRSNDLTLGFAHAPIVWAQQHESRSRHDRDMSKNELGPWGAAYNHERMISWKGMPWICRRSWFLDKRVGLGGYGALSEHKLSWGGGDLHIGVKPWLLGFRNWAVPTSPGIHIGPFPNIDNDGKKTDIVNVADSKNPYRYRLWSKSGSGPHCVGFLVSCYILGGEEMMERNADAIEERFGSFVDVKKHWKNAISLGKDEKRWLDSKKVMSFNQMIETKPWEGKPKLVGKKLKYSIVIPYQHSPERLPLLNSCLDRLTEISNNQFEICVHEVGPQRTLNLSGRYRYLYTNYSGIFHRAWAINRGVRALSTGNMLILMDGDLIVNPDWMKEVLSCTDLSVAWGKLSLLNGGGTKKFIRTKYIDRDSIFKTKSPSMGSAAGGALVIPRDLFEQVKGIPEDFTGSWGGEDNALWAKLRSLGNEIGKFKCEIFHLNHTPSTPRIGQIQKKAIPMIHWATGQWKKYIDYVGNNWGLENPDRSNYPSIEYISKKGGPKLTLAMLSWLRYDKLTETLDSLYKTLTISVNMMIMVQGSEKLGPKRKQIIRNLAKKFAATDVFFTEGNIGTGPARKKLVKRALDRFHSPYINLADDDTTYTPGSVEAALDLLDSDFSIGVVGVRYKPKVYLLDSQIHPTELVPKNAMESVQQVDCTGSASAIIRREIFDICKIDQDYIVGQWDLDLFLQVRSIGWKIVNLEAFSGMAAINNWGGCQEYKKARMNKMEINKSVARLKRRFGLRRAA